MSKEIVVDLFNGEDPRIENLHSELTRVIYERAGGELPLSTVVGILRLIEHELIQEASE